MKLNGKRSLILSGVRWFGCGCVLPCVRCSVRARVRPWLPSFFSRNLISCGPDDSQHPNNKNVGKPHLRRHALLFEHQHTRCNRSTLCVCACHIHSLSTVQLCTLSCFFQVCFLLDTQRHRQRCGLSWRTHGAACLIAIPTTTRCATASIS